MLLVKGSVGEIRLGRYTRQYMMDMNLSFLCRDLEKRQSQERIYIQALAPREGCRPPVAPQAYDQPCNELAGGEVSHHLARRSVVTQQVL